MSEQTKQSVCPIGMVKAICVSDRRGIEKGAVEEGHLLMDFGIGGDVHAGHWHRQVGLLSYDKVGVFNERRANIIDEAFGENLVVEGIDFRSLPVGTRLYAGIVQLEMTQMGRECHSHCAVYKCMGEYIMPRESVFARVIREGTIHPGDVTRVESPTEKRSFTVAVVTLSDKDVRGERRNEGGPVAKELLEAAGYGVVELLFLSNEPVQLKTQLIYLADSRRVDPVLTSGGTGSPLRDQTSKTIMAMAECGTPGITEFIRMKPMGVTDWAMFSGGVSAIRRKTLIVNLPGSPRAVKEGLGPIMGSLNHGFKILRGSASECARN